MKQVVAALVLALGVASPSYGQGQPTGAPAAGLPMIKVTSNGREPRVMLQLAPPVGTVDRVELTAKSKQLMTVNGEAAPDSHDATMRFMLRVEVTKQSEEGTEYALELLGVEGTMEGDKPRDALAAGVQYEKAKGAKGTLVLGAHGRTTRVALTAPADAPPQAGKAVNLAVEALEQVFATVWPEEGVGAGASWGVTEVGGKKDPMAPTYQLTIAGQDRFVIKGSASGAVSPDELPVPQGAKVTSSKKALTTEQTVLTNRAFPLNASTTMKMSADISVSDPSGGSGVARVAVTMEKANSLRSLQTTPAKKTGG